MNVARFIFCLLVCLLSVPCVSLMNSFGGASTFILATGSIGEFHQFVAKSIRRHFSIERSRVPSSENSIRIELRQISFE